MPLDNYLTPEQAAERLQCSIRTIRRMIASGDLPAYRLNKRLIRLKVTDVQALLKPVPTAVA